MCNLIDREFLVMRKSEINPSAFERVSNDDYSYEKPIGGLWSSPFEESIGSQWVRFCSNEMPMWLSRDCVKFKLKEASKVFILDSELKLKELIVRYPREIEYGLLRTRKEIYLDFESLSKDYDAFYLDYTWFREFAFNNDEFKYFYLFNRWDVSSLLVFNLDCIKSWEYYELNVEEEYYE